MLVPLTNEAMDYEWGSTSLIASLQGREPSVRREAELWFGTHPLQPAKVPDGRGLGQWIAEETLHDPDLPFLLKLLAAESVLSIQAHPSRRQAEAGFAREEALGIPVTAPHRTYRDSNHKPELIVAISDEFQALAGLRPFAASRRLFEALGNGARGVVRRLRRPDITPRELVAWVLSAGASLDVRDAVDAAVNARSDEFRRELDLARQLNAAHPGDPGVLLALLMNLVTLRPGEGLFIPAGLLHAYVCGLGVELMAASDNVLRGGLTSKHIDTPGLIDVLDRAQAGPAVLVPSGAGEGLRHYPVPVGDFALYTATLVAGVEQAIAVPSMAILLAGEGEVTLSTRDATLLLAPGTAAFLDPRDRRVRITGIGQVFVATAGAPLESD